MRTGTGPTTGPNLPVYHSRRGAARNALRIFLVLLASSAFFVLAGWPSASTAMVQVSALGGLSATNPNPWGFAVGALIAMPLAIVTVGITEFVVLDGADAYPLLAIAILPTILAGCLLIAAGKPALFGIGFLFIVYTPILLSPSNPQDYNPLSYLTTSLFCLVAVLIIAAGVAAVLPTDDARRRGWLLSAARHDLRTAIVGRCPDRLTIEEASFQAADRIAQLDNLEYADKNARDATLAHALHLAEVTFSALSLCEALVGWDNPAADDVRTALANLDVGRLRAGAKSLSATLGTRSAGATATRMAALIERRADDIALAAAGKPPGFVPPQASW